MKKHDPSLFQIGEVIKVMGTTRKKLLIYEELGLLTPAVKDPISGYRYYSADNMTQIRSIQSLQMLGLSLKEVADYYYDTKNIDAYLQRMMELRASLDRNIQLLQVRSTKRGDLTVRKVTLPRQVCFSKCYTCTGVTESANVLRNTYIDAARTGKMSMLSRMFTMRLNQTPEKFDLQCCIAMAEDFDGPERITFEETPALCIYHRGSYEEMPIAVRALMEYVKKNNVTVAGPIRSIYMEGPPNRGKNTGDYITQIAIPIQE